jgi:hypothetical protein
LIWRKECASLGGLIPPAEKAQKKSIDTPLVF